MARPTLPPDWFHCDPPYVGGAEVYVQWHLEYAGPEALGLIVVDRPALRGWIEELQGQGFAVQRLSPGSWRSRLGALRELVSRLQPRVLHLNLPHPYDGIFGMAPLAARLGGARRIVATEHLPGVGRVGKRYWAKRAAVPWVDAAISVCRRHRETLVDTFHYPAARVHAIPNGVPDRNPGARIWAAEKPPLPDELARQERGGGLRVVQLGSLDLRKGGDLLIEAVARLAAEGGAPQLWFVGEGLDRPALEAQVRESGLEERIHFAGHRGDVIEILRAADLVVLASRREGLPLSLLEALCQGLPILASEVDGVAEIVIPGETGVLVPPENPAQIARELRFLLADEARRIEFGRAARARYESEHTLETMCRRTFAVHRGTDPAST